GHLEEALWCMELVQTTCPGSTLATRAWAILYDVAVYCGSVQGGEEASEDGLEDEDAGNLWLDEVEWEWTRHEQKPKPSAAAFWDSVLDLGACVLQAACPVPLPRFVNVYSSDPDPRILQQLNDAQHMRIIEAQPHLP